MPSDRIKATVILACLVIWTLQIIGMGRSAYKKSDMMVMIESAYDDALKDWPLAHVCGIFVFH